MPNPLRIETNLASPLPPDWQWRVDGKFFSESGQRVSLRGVTYGPFPPGAGRDLFPEPQRVRRDLELLRELGCNVLRCYTVPPEWIFDLAQEAQIKLFVDIPWNYQMAFLDDAANAAEAVRSVRRFAQQFARHPALFAACLANEIPPDIVRWSGAVRISRFLDGLVNELKSVDDSVLATICGYPRTEYLVVRDCDFMCFNVYLHERSAFSDYLARLQTIAGPKPLVLGEIGFDSRSSSEARQAEHLSWQLDVAERESVAGSFVYSFCDEWFKDGRLVEDWAFGLLRSDRSKKQSFTAVKEAFSSSDAEVSKRDLPLVSIVVAAYNAERTIVACVESLLQLVYPRIELIVVDDGSIDDTRALVNGFKEIRVVQLPVNQGLSAARNAGIEASSGEIVAFTDADCRVDSDWVGRLVQSLKNDDFVGVGGHNIIPDETNQVAAAVGVAPGGPIHIMLTDRVAEHIPGCNMAFYRSVLDEVNGFDSRFRVAGDDVDLCWRIQQNGHRIGFSAGGFVWHDRRSTVRAYLKQQMGYGKAEALLAQKFPALFNWMGDHTWKGRIYDESAWLGDLSRQVIYRGVYGRGLFQLLPFGRTTLATVLPVSLEFHVFVTGSCLLLGFVSFYFWIVSFLGLATSTVLCARAAWQVALPRPYRNLSTRFLVCLLYFLQPVCRSYARYRAQWSLPNRSVASQSHEGKSRRSWRYWATVRKRYWSENEGDRLQLIESLSERLSQRGWATALDDGYQDFDISAHVGLWGRLEFLSAEEFFPGNRRQVRTRLRFRWSRVTVSLFVGLIAMLTIGISWMSETVWRVGFAAVPVLLAGSWLMVRVRGYLSAAEHLLDQVAIALGMNDVSPRDEFSTKDLN